jgi:hypothetical protein
LKRHNGECEGILIWPLNGPSFFSSQKQS